MHKKLTGRATSSQSGQGKEYSVINRAPELKPDHQM